jgi:DNA mismatch repair protein MutS
VAFFFALDSLRRETQAALETVYDLERLSTRIALNRCSPKDFMALRSSLEHLPGLKEKLSQAAAQEQDGPGLIRETLKGWDDLDDVHTLLKTSLVDNPPTIVTEGGLFRSGYNRELDELLDLTEHGESKLKELLHTEQTRHDLPKLKLGFNRVFGYYFELSKAHKGPVPEHFHRRQTLVNSERYVTDELKDLEDKLFSASERRKNLEYDLFQGLRSEVHAQQDRITAMAEILGRVDVWQGLAQAGRTREWSRPEVHTGLDIKIEQGRHPAVEASLGRADYIPNDLSLTPQGNILLITGPNMAGKSTVLRQAAIICILAQIGSFVPAKSSSIGLADRIFTRVGASDNLAQGRSTFMVEMTETARILRQAGKRSLIILDEIGRGTSTYDGMALAWAVVENLAHKGEQGVRTLFATHFHELTELESTLPGVRNFNIAVKEWKGDVIFLRRMVPGPADRSYGIEVARLAGVPRPVIQRARELLSDLERKSGQLHRRPAERQTSQSLLPGLFQPAQKSAPPGKNDGQPHPLVQRLRDLNLEEMTPLQALNLLQEWKNTWSER